MFVGLTLEPVVHCPCGRLPPIPHGKDQILRLVLQGVSHGGVHILCAKHRHLPPTATKTGADRAGAELLGGHEWQGGQLGGTGKMGCLLGGNSKVMWNGWVGTCVGASSGCRHTVGKPQTPPGPMSRWSLLSHSSVLLDVPTGVTCCPQQCPCPTAPQPQGGCLAKCSASPRPPPGACSSEIFISVFRGRHRIALNLSEYFIPPPRGWFCCSARDGDIPTLRSPGDKLQKKAGWCPMSPPARWGHDTATQPPSPPPLPVQGWAGGTGITGAQAAGLDKGCQALHNSSALQCLTVASGHPSYSLF